jgi:hypothetical protein
MGAEEVGIPPLRGQSAKESPQIAMSAKQNGLVRRAGAGHSGGGSAPCGVCQGLSRR